MEQEAIQELKAELDQQIIDYYTALDSKGRLVNAPKNDDELHEFIEVALGFSIPRKVIEPGHASPFKFIADLFFERVKNAVGFASRNGGKTLNLAVLNFCDMFFKHGCEVASAGAVKTQAKQAYGYFQSFLDLKWFKEFSRKYKRLTKIPFVEKAIQEETKFGNKSEQTIITATERGLRSPHPHKARIDEVDLIEWSTLQTGLSMARSDGRIKGQNVFTSTRQLTNGSMQRMLECASQKGFQVYEWNIWEAVEQCNRKCFDDPEHGTCPIYTFCKGKAHDCAGFYKIEDFIDKTRVLDRETFETEWLNKRPARSKLVYGSFEETRHVMTQKKLVEMTRHSTIQRSWPRISGIDFGSSPGHPFAYIKLCQLPGGAWLVFHEYYAYQKLMRDHAQAIKGSPLWVPSEYMYSDHAGQERLELKDLGIRTRKAQKDVLMGIDYVSTLLKGFPPKEIPQLYVWHGCYNLIKEFSRYRWPVTPDGRVDKTSNPLKADDHGLDALRYALFTYKHKPARTYRSRYVEGI